MDRKITVRFFRIAPVHETAPAFEEALRIGFECAPTPVGRERSIGSEIIVRMERLAPDATCLEGEIIRRQSTNIPPEARDDGLAPLKLTAGGGLGHCVAFRYHPALRIMAMQFDNRAVSVNRLLAYLAEIDRSLSYNARLLVRSDAWDRYNRGEPRSFDIEIANPGALHNVEGDVESALEGSRTLAEVFDAPLIRIHVSMGSDRRGVLRKGALERVINFFTKGAGRDADVRNLAVGSKPADGSRSETIDFLDEALMESEVLDLPEGQPDVHYERRRQYVRQCMNLHLDYIRQAYG